MTRPKHERTATARIGTERRSGLTGHIRPIRPIRPVAIDQDYQT